MWFFLVFFGFVQVQPGCFGVGEGGDWDSRFGVVWDGPGRIVLSGFPGSHCWGLGWLKRLSLRGVGRRVLGDQGFFLVFFWFVRVDAGLFGVWVRVVIGSVCRLVRGRRFFGFFPGSPCWGAGLAEEVASQWVGLAGSRGSGFLLGLLRGCLG